jgi:hypothetical protein
LLTLCSASQLGLNRRSGFTTDMSRPYIYGTTRIKKNKKNRPAELGDCTLYLSASDCSAGVDVTRGCCVLSGASSGTVSVVVPPLRPAKAGTDKVAPHLRTAVSEEDLLMIGQQAGKWQRISIGSGVVCPQRFCLHRNA